MDKALIVTAISTASLFFVSCSPEDVPEGIWGGETNASVLTNPLTNSNDAQVSLPTINCSNQGDANNQIIGTDTRVETKSESRGFPLDMTISVKAEVAHLSKSDIETAYIIMPNGDIEKGRKWSYSEASTDEYNSPSAVNVYGAYFETYIPQEGIRRIPTNNYCFIIQLKDSTYIARSFDLERPDGTEPNLGEQYIHYTDRSSIGGGSYSYAINEPTISDINIVEGNLVVSVAFDDPRIQRVRVNVYNSVGKKIGLAVIEDLSYLQLSGSKTYTLSLSDFRFQRV